MSDELHDDAVARLIQIAGPRRAVPVDVAARVKANVHAAWRAEVDARTRGRFLWTLPLAAAIATAIILTITHQPVAPTRPWVVARIDRVSGASSLSAGAPIEARSSITTSNERASVRLPDGTSVRIDQHSRVRFDTPHRLAVESGAIYVVAARSGIRVQTPFGMVRDIGTRFEVRVTGGATRVRVRDGEVIAAARHLVRGEQLDARPGSAITSKVPTWGPDWEWTMDVAPRFAIEGARVSQFLDWVGSESGLEIRYDSPATAERAARTTLHGSMSDLRPDVAAVAILPTAGLRATVGEGVLTVRQ